MTLKYTYNVWTDLSTVILNVWVLNPISNVYSNLTMSFNTNDLEMQPLTQSYTKLYNRKQRRIKINRGQLVKLIFSKEKTYHPCKAKIIDDSFDGCGLVVKSNHNIYKGQKVLMLKLIPR